MRKGIAVLLIGAMAAMTMLSGCSKDSSSAGSSAEAEAEGREVKAKELLKATDYDVEDYVTLMDDYMNLSVELDSDYEVTDSAVKDYIDTYVLPYYPMYVASDKTTVEAGDIVNIDYTGTLNGEEFDGGSAAGYNLTIGSGSFIDGFEDGLIGAAVGSTLDLNLTFPEDYGKEELNGKAVVFTVTVNNIMNEKNITYDEMTDDYVASTFSSYGFSTVDDLVADVTTSLESQYESERQSDLQSKVLAALEDGCTVELPDGLLDERVDRVVSQAKESAEEQDMEYADYISTYYGYSDEEEFKTYITETLEGQLIQELILEAIVADQKTSINTADFDQFVSDYVSYYGYDSAEDFYEVYGGEEFVMLSYAENTVFSQVIESATTTVAEAAEEESE